MPNSSGYPDEDFGGDPLDDSYEGDSASPRFAAGSEEDPDAGASASPQWTRRLVALLAGLLRIHLQIAATEARRDQQRLVRGIVYVGVAGFLALLALLLSEGLALWGLLQIPLRWPWALSALIGSNLTVAGLLLLLARRSLQSPVMPETRALLRRTMRSLFLT